MLEEAFQLVYTKFKMHFYRQAFRSLQSREATLTTVETFCMESIVALGSPTVAEFSQFMNISTPNAAYKVNSLIQKGYVEKIRSEKDHREYHLLPTQKYFRYYNLSYSYLRKVVQRAKERFSQEDLKKLEEMLVIVGNELMPEMNCKCEIPAQAAEVEELEDK